MRYFFTTSASLLLTSSAIAHPGHFAESTGHDHGVLAIAALVAVLFAIGAFVKNKRSSNV